MRGQLCTGLGRANTPYDLCQPKGRTFELGHGGSANATNTLLRASRGLELDAAGCEHAAAGRCVASRTRHGHGGHQVRRRAFAAGAGDLLPSARDPGGAHRAGAPCHCPASSAGDCRPRYTLTRLVECDELHECVTSHPPSYATPGRDSRGRYSLSSAAPVRDHSAGHARRSGA